MSINPSPTPERAVYGFVLYLLATSAFILYLAWLFLPEETLEQLGFTFLPQKYWSVAIPIYLSVAFVTFVFVVYPSLGLLLTPPLESGDIRYVLDERTVYTDKSSCSEVCSAEEISEVFDLHPTLAFKRKKDL